MNNVGQFFIRFFSRFVCFLPHLICFCNSILSQYYVSAAAICFQCVTYEKRSLEMRTIIKLSALQRNQFPDIPTNSSVTLSRGDRCRLLPGFRVFLRYECESSQVSELCRLPSAEVCISDKWNIIHEIIEFPCVTRAEHSGKASCIIYFMEFNLLIRYKYWIIQRLYSGI